MDQQLTDQLTSLIDGAHRELPRPRPRRRVRGHRPAPRPPAPAARRRRHGARPELSAALGPQLDRKSRVKTASSLGSLEHQPVRGALQDREARVGDLGH